MIKDVPNILDNIYKEIKNFTEIAVIHLSGDINSTILTTILVESLGDQNVYGLYMPNENDFTNPEIYANPFDIAKKLNITLVENNIVSLTSKISHDLNEIVSKINHLNNKEISPRNLKNSESRARMSLLYGVRHHLSQVTNKKTRVIGSVNLSQDFINYYPEGGESLVDLLPLAELFDSEIEEIGNYLAEKKVIDKKLLKFRKEIKLCEHEMGNQDVMFTSDDLEKSIRKIASDDWCNSEWLPTDEFVWKRHFENKNKSHLIRVLSLRENFCDGGGFKSIRNSNRSLR